MVEKLLEHFMKKNCKKQKEFRIEKVIKKKDDKLYVNYMSNGKDLMIHLR